MLMVTVVRVGSLPGAGTHLRLPALQHLLWIGHIEEIELGVDRHWWREPHLQVQVQVQVQVRLQV